MNVIITQEKKDAIDRLCKDYYIENYTINGDGSVDVTGDVNLAQCNMHSIEINFNRVSGNFDCSGNFLSDLNGAPNEVGYDFLCDVNQLTSLEGSPVVVGGKFTCSYNKLISLVGSPVEVNGDFDCSRNQLFSLVGGPTVVHGHFICGINILTSLVGCPIEVGNDFICNDNKLTTLVGGPKLINGRLVCTFNELTSLNGEYTVGLGVKFSNNKLPKQFIALFDFTQEEEVIFFKHQHDYKVWIPNFDGGNMIGLIENISEGLT